MPGRTPAVAAKRAAPSKARAADSKQARAQDRAAKASLAGFLSRFEPEVAALARAALRRARALTPPSYELVYDAYNALSIGFGLSERTSEHFLHVAVYPRHVNLGFPFGTSLSDRGGRLEGDGARVRHLSVHTRSELAEPALAGLVREAVAQAMARATTPPPVRRQTIIKAVYASQRPRRPPTR
jgi:hypothetical protein